ncbi:PBP superfamily domain protein [Andreesenia angusta]|uniref:PBP superfamily domain protein n=1 Tax=Andreesenia angusta TaxID=39480 RepID=A0A1S1V4G3_9FIRM|nr:substrate-binding domain-containing protein [Andreesenia angusta]OHW61344.1 PBP superfamily domain protein [Andreesenia angusta]
MKKKSLLALLMVLMLSITALVGCGNSEPAEDTSKESTETSSDEKQELGEIILSTTTSTQDSGLLDYLLPVFEEKTGATVKTVAVGTGAALEMGQNGEADVLLVHAKADEEKFVADGYGTERHDVMYNDFVLVGPKEDALKLKETSGSDIQSALKNISNSGSTFVSRGDDSGTHKKELKLWEETGISPQGEWYVSAGAGMADVLKIASEKQAYTITDRATYLSLKDTLDLDVLVEGDKNLFNQYGVIPVNPEREDNAEINEAGAKAFMDWILSEEAQKLIGEYGVEEFGEPLFVPNAK